MRQKIGELIQRPEAVFLTLALVFGVFSAFLVPQLAVSDESVHFLRAYNLASGSLGDHNCHYPADIVQKSAVARSGIYSADYGHKLDTSHIISGSCGSAASYSPVMHLPQAIGVLIAKLIYPSAALMVLFGRLANLIFYAGILYYVIKKVRIGKWAFVVIGLFPTMIHLGASLSSDVMNDVVVIAFAAFIFNLFTQKTKLDRKQAVILVVLSCLLALTKIVNVVLLLPLAFLPASLFGINKPKHLPFNISKWSLVGLGGLLSLISFYVWQKIYGASLVSTTSNPLVHHPLHFLKILYNTYLNSFLGYNDVVLRGIFGDFSAFKYHLPTFMLLFVFFVFMIALLRKDTKDERLVQKVAAPLAASSLAALALLVLVITYAMYSTWAILPTRLGPGALYADGVQGRYFASSLPLLIPTCIWLRRYISFHVPSEKMMGVIIFCGSGLPLLFYIIETYLAYNN